MAKKVEKLKEHNNFPKELFFNACNKVTEVTTSLSVILRKCEKYLIGIY